MSSGRPSSRIGTSPFFSRATRSASMSAQTHVVTEMGEAGRGRETDVSGADDRDLSRRASPGARTHAIDARSTRPARD